MITNFTMFNHNSCTNKIGHEIHINHSPTWSKYHLMDYAYTNFQIKIIFMTHIYKICCWMFACTYWMHVANKRPVFSLFWSWIFYEVNYVRGCLYCFSYSFSSIFSFSFSYSSFVIPLDDIIPNCHKTLQYEQATSV